MKAQDSAQTAVLRLLKSGLKNEQIKLGHELSDEEAGKVLAREAKQRRDSIDAYQKAGRSELAAAEQAELKVIEGYLPKQMDEAELAKLVAEVIQQTGATGPAQIGQVIGAVMQKAAGQADGAAVSALVRQKLSGGQA